MARKELLSQAKTIPALLQVGKNGLSEGFIQELSFLVKKKGVLKVRFLKSFADVNDVKAAAAQAASEASVSLLGVTGSTAVFIPKGKQ